MIVARVRRTIVARGLFGSGDRVVVACSGGPDSVAMTHTLARLAGPLDVSLVVATVDHGLRPDVRRELDLVRDLAGALSLPFHLLRVDVGAIGSTKGSLQARAREARYEALLGLAAREGAQWVAVGHTQDDQAETVLDRLLRGASVRGLAGIDPQRGDGVIRPLIDVRRSDVAAHLSHHHLVFIDDPSNEDPRFTRVRIRRHLLPTLAEEDPAVVSHLAHLADDARATRALVEQVGQDLLVAARRPRGLDAPTLARGDSVARREALRVFLEAATGVSPRRAHLVSIDQLVIAAASPGWAPHGEVLLPHQLVACFEGSILAIEARGKP